MAILTYPGIAINDFFKRINIVKNNPTLIARTYFELLDEISNGEIDILDPNNPFVYLLEVSAMSSYSAISESFINMRKSFPSLAHNAEEIYAHMAEEDFIGVYATPASAKFLFLFELNDLRAKMVKVYDEVTYINTGIKNYTGERKITIPRNTEVIIDNTKFSLSYLSI